MAGGDGTIVIRRFLEQMIMKKKKVFIVYFSPAGSVRHVAEVIEKQFLELGTEVSSFNMAGGRSDLAIIISQQMEASEGIRLHKNT